MLTALAQDSIFIVIGALYVIWVARNKFNRWPPDNARQHDLPPRTYTSYSRFAAFMFVYVCGYLAVFSAACFTPELVDSLANHVLDQENKWNLSRMAQGERALFAAFVLTGLIPNFPMLKKIDHSARRYLHMRAKTPSHAKALVEALSEDSSFRPDPVQYQQFLDRIALSLQCSPQSLLPGNTPSLASFCKLAFLVKRLEKWKAIPSKNQFLNKHHTLYEHFTDRFAVLKEKVRRYCSIMQEHTQLPDYVAAIDEETNLLLHNALELICCGVNRTTPTDAWYSRELKHFSLYPRLSAPPSLGIETITRTLVGIAAIVMLTGIGAYFVQLAMGGNVTFIPTPQQTVLWTLYSIMLHGLAITFVALYHAGRESHYRSKGTTPMRDDSFLVFNCTIGFLLGAAAGAFILMTAHYVQQFFAEGSSNMKMSVLCWTICPGATGVFISYYIQRIRKLDQSWYLYSLLQGLGTMGSVFLAAALIDVSTVFIGYRPYMMLIGFMVGATIGGIFPKHYRKRLVKLGVIEAKVAPDGKLGVRDVPMGEGRKV